MSGSGASNLGYGNITPYNNINNNYVNATSSNDPAVFSNRVIPGTPPGPLPGLAGAKSNIDAAAGRLSGGGNYRLYLKRKINNITKKYKMSKNSKKRSHIKRKLRSRARSLSGGKKHTRRTHKRHRKHNKMWRGGFASGFPAPAGVTSYPAGYGQYENNLPNTPSYSVGGILSGNAELGLANPPPITRIDNNYDNYNHYNGNTYPSRGH